MKKLLSLLLTLALSLSLAVPAFAADPVEEDNAAWTLYRLGLFQGTGTDSDGFPIFSLEDSPTRAQGVTMLVRLIGQEKAALASSWTAPFQDVPDWAKPYVGYAYENGLTTGRDEITFDPDSPLSATEYLTFVLRAMGYESGADFQWDAAWVLSDELDITDGSYNPETNTAFDRGDVAVISASALDANLKGSRDTLRDRLIDQGMEPETEFCLWTENCESILPGEMWFSFTPLEESVHTYTKFRVDRVIVNGVDCRTTQYNTPGEVLELCQEMDLADGYLEDAFALVRLTYHEPLVLSSATETIEIDGEVYPVLEFKFKCTGTLRGGNTVQEMFSFKSYFTGYGGPFA